MATPRKLTAKQSAMLVYRHMKSRCYTRKTLTINIMAGGGISICERWLGGVEFFLEDMGEKPEGLELDRKDNNQGHSADNCQWITHKQNMRNRRSNRVIEYGGKTQTLVEWSEELGFNYRIVRYRLVRGWDVIAAFTTPFRPKNKARAQHKNPVRQPLAAAQQSICWSVA